MLQVPDYSAYETRLNQLEMKLGADRDAAPSAQEITASVLTSVRAELTV